jgi:7-cyano-7-deazaguanine synthase in queuosine biosynthesis
MGETLVLCGGATAPKGRASATLRLDTSGRKENVSLSIDDISKRMVADIPDVLADLLEVAAYLYCADQLISRGGDAMQALGTGWRRRLKFVIPVREPERWRRPEISERLIRLLAFMSDEDFNFLFEPASSPRPWSSYFNFSDGGEASFQADKVALFSGGLDSLTGAVEQLEHKQERLLLVSHRSSPQVFERQKYLAGALARRFPKRVLHVPVRITKRGAEAVETTQRTRSFLFAALAVVVGQLAGQKRLRFYENGIVSFNLPIASQVVGARATRSTHPRVISDLQAFLSALLDEQVEVQNPYIWQTKSEVASAIDQSGHVDLLPHTISCSHVYGMTKLKTHCGCCSQCLDRRFATVAAGLADVDPEEMYAVDLLTGPRDDGKDRTMAESFVRHAREFVGLTEAGFINRFGGHVARAAGCFADLTADGVMQKAVLLHQRYGQAVRSVLEMGFKTHARALADGSLPDSCLLRLIGDSGSRVADSATRDPTETDSSRRLPGDGRDFLRTSEIRLALDRVKRQVVIGGIEPIGGPGAFALAAELVDAYEKDRSEGLAPENYQYLRSLHLTKVLSITEQGLRRRVMRFRKGVADSFARHFGLPLAGDAVIQNRHWKGYRLNPTIRVLALDQIEGAGKRHEARAVRHESSM